MLGFLNNLEIFVYVLVVMGFFNGAFLYLSYAMVLIYYSPTVLCTALLLEPILGQVTSCLLGMDKVPGIVTWAGALVCMVGVYLVSTKGPDVTTEIEPD